jgi:hypothetical protein
MQRTDIDPDEHRLRALERLAAEDGQTVSDFIRRAVDDYLARRLLDDAVWRERFDRLVERVRSRVPADIAPGEIEADITVAQAEVRPAVARPLIDKQPLSAIMESYVMEV